MPRKHQKNRTVLAYRIWSVTGYEEKLSLLDKHPRFTWVVRFIEGVVEFFTTEEPVHQAEGSCRKCNSTRYARYEMAMYAKARFGQRTPNVSVYA